MLLPCHGFPILSLVVVEQDQRICQILALLRLAHFSSHFEISPFISLLAAPSCLETCTNLPHLPWASWSLHLPKRHEALAHSAYVEGATEVDHQNKDLAKNLIGSGLGKSSEKARVITIGKLILNFLRPVW